MVYLAKSFGGFKERDFNSITGTSWRKDLSKCIEIELKNLTEKKFDSRIPYHVNSVYWGSQPFFNEPLMKYAYGAFFVTLTEEGMEAGYKIEKGFEEGQDFERVLTKDWEWYRFRENMKNDLFVEKLKELLREGFRLAILKDGILENLNDVEELKNRIMNEKELRNKWLDVFIYKAFKKDNVLNMRAEEVINFIVDSFKGIRSVYDMVNFKMIIDDF